MRLLGKRKYSLLTANLGFSDSEEPSPIQNGSPPNDQFLNNVHPIEATQPHRDIFRGSQLLRFPANAGVSPKEADCGQRLPQLAELASL